MTSRGFGNPIVRAASGAVSVSIESEWCSRFQEFLVHRRIVSFVEETATPVNGRSHDVLSLGKVELSRIAHVLDEWERQSGG